MGVNLDKQTDNENDLAINQQQSTGEADIAQNPNRRRFTRNAVVGSSVLLSLGNRAAWGVTPGCMSVMTLNSFDANSGTFASLPPGGKLGHDPDLAATILNPPNNFYETNCGDPELVCAFPRPVDDQNCGI